MFACPTLPELMISPCHLHNKHMTHTGDFFGLIMEPSYLI